MVISHGLVSSIIALRGEKMTVPSDFCTQRPQVISICIAVVVEAVYKPAYLFLEVPHNNIHVFIFIISLEN